MGNESRNAVYGPGTQALHFSLFKSFPIREQTRLELGQKPSICSIRQPLPIPTPPSTPTTQTGWPFQTWVSEKSPAPHPVAPRQIQFALKLIF